MNLTRHPDLRQFIEDVTAIVRRDGGEEIVTTRVAARLEALLGSPGVLDPRCTMPHADSYVLYPVRRRDGVRRRELTWGSPRGRLPSAEVTDAVGRR